MTPVRKDSLDPQLSMDSIQRQIQRASFDWEALMQVCRLVKCGTDLQVAVANGAGPLIVQLLRTYPCQLQIQRLAFAALAALATVKCSNLFAVLAGALGDILDMMSLHQTDSEIQSTGCSFLARLAEAPGESAHIVHGGGLVAIVRAMRSFRKVSDVASSACLALAALLRGLEDEKKRSCVYESGAPELVLELLMNQPQPAALCAAAYDALAGICAKAEGRERIIALGGVEIIVEIIMISKAVPEALEGALYALRPLTTTKAAMPLLAAVHFDMLFVGVMDRHPGHLALQRCCCDLLRRLSEDPCHQTLLLTAGAVQSLHRALQHHNADTQLVAYAERALRNLTETVVVDFTRLTALFGWGKPKPHQGAKAAEESSSRSWIWGLVPFPASRSA